jgi:hypothetical protein
MRTAKSLPFGLFLLMLWIPLAALGAPRWVRVSPTSDPSRSMFVAWNTDAMTESRVEYGTTAAYGQEATGTAEDAGSDLNVIHTVELTGLEPDTAYHYRVGNPSDGWSQDQVFYTGPADLCAPFTFALAADNRGDFAGSSACWEALFGLIAAEAPAFVINSGDLVREGKNASEWADFLRRSEAHMGTVAILPAIGNHDDDDVEGDGAKYNQIFALPRNSANNTEDFYSFDYGNVHFACLSTSSFDFATQYAWLEQDLAATDKLWKVVFFHVPVYSSGSHGSNEDGKTWGYIPLFDQYHVDLVVTGHDHIYERYKPKVDHQVVASYEEGTCYMVSGGGGAATDPIYIFRPKEDGLEVGDALHHWVKITVSNNVMHIKAERVNVGACILQGGQGVIDEFDIVKTLSSDPCVGPTDLDGDGHSPPLDCNDSDASVHPGAAEVCGDGVDQNCDGQDQVCPCIDSDLDGYQDQACGGNDCDDASAAVNPSAIETCGDGIDQDCDGFTDEAGCEMCVDADQDGRQAIDASCPSGDDCDDSDPDVFPGAFEWCNQADDNCDGQIDEDGACGANCTDADADGHNVASADCPAGTDCDDTDPAVHPGAPEACNAVDDDCDGLTDEDLGTQACGVGACAALVPACLDGQPLQCHPGLAPEAAEVSCSDGQDNDCDGYTDLEDDSCKASGCGCGSAGESSKTAGLLGLWLGLLCLARGRLRGWRCSLR